MPHSNWKYGQPREDGYIFDGWKRRGEKVTPDFRNPVSFKKQNEASKIRKQIKSRKIKAIENNIKTEINIDATFLVIEMTKIDILFCSVSTAVMWLCESME